MPQARTNEGLGAVKEALLDLNTDRDERHLALGDASLEQGGVACNPRLPVDSQCFFTAGHHEDQADVRVREQIEHAVKTLVARALRDDEPSIVEHLDEAGRVAFRRYVAASAGIRRRRQQEWRLRNERAGVWVERVLYLLHRARTGRADDRSQILLSCQDV